MTSSSFLGETFFGINISGFAKLFRAVIRRISRSVLLIEFGPQWIQLAEALPLIKGVRVHHITRIALPDGALSRSIPSDPAAMARLIQETCLEKGIITHRASVVLPPEVAFQRVVYLADDLDNPREYLLNPSSGVQIPFPISRTDFEITPLVGAHKSNVVDKKTAHLLTAIPSSMVDQVISMLELSDLELQTLELGSFSSLRCIHSAIQEMPEDNAFLVLEFLSETTLAVLVGSSGPLAMERLASIREFPSFELTNNQYDQILTQSLSLDEVTIGNERYLALSEMDLRSLNSDLQAVMSDFANNFNGLSITQIWLMGEGSAYPEISELLQKRFSLPVHRCRPFLSSSLSDYSFDDPILQSSMNRLVGLGLGLISLPNQQFKNNSTNNHTDQAKAELLSAELVPINDSENVIDSEDLSSVIESHQLDFSTPSNDQTITPVEVKSMDTSVSDQPVSPDNHLLFGVSSEKSDANLDDQDSFKKPNSINDNAIDAEENKIAGLMDKSNVEEVNSEKWPSISAVDSETDVGNLKLSDTALGDQAEFMSVPKSANDAADSSNWPTISPVSDSAVGAVSVDNQPNDSLESNVLPGLDLKNDKEDDSSLWPTISQADSSNSDISNSIDIDQVNKDLDQNPEFKLPLNTLEDIQASDSLSLPLAEDTQGVINASNAYQFHDESVEQHDILQNSDDTNFTPKIDSVKISNVPETIDDDDNLADSDTFLLDELRFKDKN